MKRASIFIVLLLLAATPALGQEGYIGLYIDEARSGSCVTGVGFYPVEMWIWTLPGANGEICAEYMVTYPANIIQSTQTKSPLISVELGDIASGYSVCFVECLWNWTWILHQLLYVTDSTPAWVEIAKHPDPTIACVQLANCLSGYPTECMKVFTKLGINRECPPDEPVSIEKKSWGAIKGLYR